METTKMPSRRTSALLATAMLAVGIALGALIGPGPAASLASSSRAAAIGRVLALIALGSGTSSGGNLALSSGAANPPASTPQPTPPTTSETAAGSGKASGGAGSASPTPRPSTSPSSSKVSPSSSTTPAAGGEEESEKTPKPKPLPPIADAWVIELPYGASLENALKQSTAAPYLDGQLQGAGTVLSNYSSLAAAQLAGAATLLSGQVGASVTTVAPPPCTGTAAGAASGTTSGSAAGAPASSTNQPVATAACPSGEPAGVQAADAFLQEVVPKIEASTAYKEHGLIVVTFGAASQQGASSSTTTSATAGTGAEATYPAGSITSTLTAAGAPAGALLLSPFLSHVGTRSASAFNPLAPHESLEALFRAKAPS
ncbi:MAG TPA: hypothetical protein VG147_01690 [Solirubrobacteraceae bacterium]|nr:hypothetical protein [Solirubrobacteraceae bacterium]